MTPFMGVLYRMFNLRIIFLVMIGMFEVGSLVAATARSSEGPHRCSGHLWDRKLRDHHRRHHHHRSNGSFEQKNVHHWNRHGVLDHWSDYGSAHRRPINHLHHMEVVLLHVGAFRNALDLHT